MAGMMETLLSRGMPDGAMVLNINFPLNLTAQTAVRWVPLQHHGYGSLFVREEDGFVHRFAGKLENWHEGPNDRDTLMAGEISVTAISLAGLSIPVAGPTPF
jgi:broad specificity polyphosphatase/5'/3'-nucleotidase SurE